MIAVQAALVAAGSFFLTGLLTGVWKYRCMANSEQAQVPYYVDTAHRTSLLYAFACLLLVEFATRSKWPDAMNLAAVLTLVFWFASAVVGYIIHGFLRDTNNQFQKPHRMGSRIIPPALLRTFMVALIAFEVGAFLVFHGGHGRILSEGQVRPSRTSRGYGQNRRSAERGRGRWTPKPELREPRRGQPTRAGLGRR